MIFVLILVSFFLVVIYRRGYLRSVSLSTQYYVLYVLPSWFKWLMGQPELNIPKLLYVTNELTMSVTHLRRLFSDTELVRPVVVSNHPHPNSAGDRTRANAFFDAMSAQSGLGLYAFAASLNDQKMGRLGAKYWQHSRDVQVEPKEFDPPDHSIITMVDADYCVNMEELLVNQVSPYLIYTFQPDQVAAVRDEYSYTFNKSNELIFTLNGAGNYTQRLWNYASDTLVVKQQIMGVTSKFVVYHVDRRRIGTDRQIVFLVPDGAWTGYRAILAERTIEGPQLKRLVVAHGDFLRLKVHDNSLAISTGLAGMYCSATIPAHIDDSISVFGSLSSVGLQISSVQSYLESEKLDCSKEVASVLVKYHRANIVVVPDVVFPVHLAVRRYQYDDAKLDVDSKPLMSAFMSPIVHEAFVPDNVISSEVRAINGRINEVKTEVDITQFMQSTMVEFSKQLIPKQGLLFPVDEDVVFARQNRPAQRQLLAKAQVSMAKRVINSFLKKEPYQEIKDPRVISTYNCVDKLEYSKYIYSMADLIDKQPWYAFAKTPQEVSSRVAQICMGAQDVVTTDLSRFDGRVSNALRMLERMCLARAFHSKYVEQVLKLHDAMYKLHGYGTFGTFYESGTTRGSGSPETALFNSICNAYMAYLTYRLMGFSADDSFRRLGLYGGDDGLTADVDPIKYEQACKLVGQKLTIDLIKRGQPKVNFLARYYSPDVWFGETNSCCDIARQLSKLHVTVNLPSNITPQAKLGEKLRGYALCDSHTPVISELVITGNNLGLLQLPEVTEIRTWWSQYDYSVHYKNVREPWMFELLNEQIPDFDFEKLKAAIGRCSEPKHLLALPLMAEPKPPQSAKAVVLLNDDVKLGSNVPIVPPSPTSSVSSTRSKDSRKGVRARKAYRKTKDLVPSPVVPPQAGTVKT